MGDSEPAKAAFYRWMDHRIWFLQVNTSPLFVQTILYRSLSKDDAKQLKSANHYRPVPFLTHGHGHWKLPDDLPYLWNLDCPSLRL